MPMAILSNFNFNSFYNVVSFFVITNQKMARKKHYKIHILIDKNVIPIKLTWLIVFKK
jgi:hypothetical protein